MDPLTHTYTQAKKGESPGAINIQQIKDRCLQFLVNIALLFISLESADLCM